MNFFDDHNKLFKTALGLFLALTIIIAILPAIKVQNNNAPLPGYKPLTKAEEAGKLIYINNGCMACHTQQVRNVDMDKIWGSRPGIPADYAGNTRVNLWVNTATLMGTERTGPDLTNIGIRQSSLAWNLLHLYQPRAVVGQSMMPAYPWLFEERVKVREGDVEVIVPDEYRKGVKGSIVATEDALNLVAYLQSLKQVKLPDGTESKEFLYKQTKVNKGITDGIEDKLDGALLYTTHCAACHQADGLGLKGAFPPIKDSKIVLSDDIETFVNVIMLGYDARPEYSVMAAVGLNSELTAEEVTAIMNHERTSFGNNAAPVELSQVKQIVDFIKLTHKDDY